MCERREAGENIFDGGETGTRKNVPLLECLRPVIPVACACTLCTPRIPWNYLSKLYYFDRDRFDS